MGAASKNKLKPTKVLGAIGSDYLPGLSKMAEENGEALQVIGKIWGKGDTGAHWDGKKDLVDRLIEEMSDQIAAISWFCHQNDIDIDQARVNEKFAKFERWHNNIQEGRGPNDDG